MMFCKMKVLLILSLAVTVFANANGKDDIVDDRIVGGVEMKIENRSFQVAVLPLSFICGGSLIDAQWVLTASHCTKSFTESEIRIRAGSDFYYTGGITRGVVKIIQHADFDPETLHNDIALLRLTNIFPFGPKINVIPLATEIPPVGTDVSVSGFGTLASGGKIASLLMAVTVTLVDFDDCNKSYENGLTDGMICAASNGKDACQGDSGGPLTYENKLIGVVSFGNGCADEAYPGIYTSVPYFTGWVEQQKANYLGSITQNS